MLNRMQLFGLGVVICFFSTMAPVLPVDSGYGGMDNLRLSAPPPPQPEVVRLEDIMPSTVKVDLAPVHFILWQNDKLRYGPALFKEGAGVEIETAVYALTNLSSKAFSLIRMRDGFVSGPFEYRENAEVNLGATVFQVRMMAPHIRGRLQTSGLVLARVPVGLISFNERTASHIARLYSEYQTYIMEVKAASAPVEIIAPRVKSWTGVNRDNYIDRSAADVARVEDSAEIKARKAFERFLSKAGARTAICPNSGDFVFQNVRPGRYLVCMMAARKEAEPGLTFRSKSLIWWADLTLDESHMATMLFSSDNAQPWQSLFPERR